MTRSLVLLGTLLLSGLLAGCSGDTREDLISNTVNAMDEAAKEVELVAKDVNLAVDKAKKENSNQLDFTDTLKATEKLAATGRKMQKIKGDLEATRSSITEEERKENAKEQAGRINNSFKRLFEQQEKLENALKAAAEVNRAETQKLRDKIREAIGPFESLSRQSA
jgi:uncharacterized protein YciI